MSTTVRIKEEDKDRLDRLQAKITLETGEKPSLEEVLHRLVILGQRSQGDLLHADEVSQWSEAEKEAVMSATHDLGFQTSWEDIDNVLYGEPEGNA